MIPFPSPDRDATRTPRDAVHAIHVIHDGRLGARCAVLLADAGVPVTLGAADVMPLALPADAIVVLATDRPRPSLALRIDADAWKAGVPWTSGTLIAHEFRVGPSIVRGLTPCFDCWSRRVRSVALDLDAHDALETLARSDDRSPWFRGVFAPVIEQVAALLAAEALTLAQRVMTTDAADRADADAVHRGDARLGLVWEGDAVAGALQVRRFASIGVCPRCSAHVHAATCASALADYVRAQPLAPREPSAAAKERTA